MAIVLKYPIMLSQFKLFSRSLSTSASLYLKEWRVERGLCVNRNAEGILTERPDFTYLDGRPSPIPSKQRKRIVMQRKYAARMVELCSELDFAKQRYQDMEEAKVKEREHVIANRLKPKGAALLKNKK